MAGQEYFTKAEAAEYTRISRATIDRLMKAGKVRFVKVGKKVVFRRLDLDRFMAARVVKK